MDFERLIATLNDYIIVASVIVIAIRKSINCAALIHGHEIFHFPHTFTTVRNAKTVIKSEQQ